MRRTIPWSAGVRQAVRLSTSIIRTVVSARSIAMRVDTKDGTCRSCGGELAIIDADDATMTVECQECGDSYHVEPDAFGDGCMTYYAGFLREVEDLNE
jgi:transcription elongation factor Elf1